MATDSASQKPSGSSAMEMKHQQRFLWKKFKANLSKLFESSRDEKKLKIKEYMGMYTYVYNFSKGQSFSDKKLKCTPATTGGYPITTDQLYFETQKHLKKFLFRQLVAGKQLKAGELIHFYTTLWKKYRLNSKILNNIFRYFNEYFIEWRVKEGMKDFFEIYWMALIIWKETVFEKLHEDVTRALVDLIEKERRGERVDTSSICGAIESYVELGLVEKEEPYKLVDSIALRVERKNPHLTIYQKYFEKDFLMKTELFYVKEAFVFLKKNFDLNECTQKMEKLLEEEEKRVEMYVHKSTGDRVKQRFQLVFSLISDDLVAITKPKKCKMLFKKPLKSN